MITPIIGAGVQEQFKSLFNWPLREAGEPPTDRPVRMVVVDLV